MEYGYFFYVIMGFLSGSILFGRLIPMIFRGVDVQTESEDGNPGTFNAFACGGAFCGILVLLADLGKGALPVALCARDLGMDSWMFALVMAAPVFGHAHSLFQKGHCSIFWSPDRTASSVEASGSSDFLVSAVCYGDPVQIQYQEERIYLSGFCGYRYADSADQNCFGRLCSDVRDCDT